MVNNFKKNIKYYIILFIGFWIGLVVSSLISDYEIKKMEQEIEELKMENTVLKEENQDIMGLWSDLVIEKDWGVNNEATKIVKSN